jgi:hypothetical protein
VIHWNLGPKVACAPHSKTIAKRHMGLGFLSSQSSINLFFVTVHPALYEDLIPYVHVAHDLESLVRSTGTNAFNAVIGVSRVRAGYWE